MGVEGGGWRAAREMYTRKFKCRKKEGLDVKSLTSLDERRWERGEGRGGRNDSERLKG